jgi:hypothetical protein
MAMAGAETMSCTRYAKSLKKLRYSIEFLTPLYKAKLVKLYLRGCKKLGALNDAAVARGATWR